MSKKNHGMELLNRNNPEIYRHQSSITTISPLTTAVIGRTCRQKKPKSSSEPVHLRSSPRRLTWSLCVHSMRLSVQFLRGRASIRTSSTMLEEMTTASTRPPLEIRRTLLSKLMSPHNHRTDRPRYKDAPSSGRAVIPTVENQGLSVLQLNAEGLTNAKLEVIRQLADSNQVAVVLLQETHRTQARTQGGFVGCERTPL